MIKSFISKIILVLFFGIGTFSCQKTSDDFPPTDLSKENLIPKPLTITPTYTSFILDENSSINTVSDSKFESVGVYLSESIKNKTQLNIPVNSSNKKNSKGGIHINKVSSLENLSNESYELIISKDSIVVNATSDEGAFRAIQTIRQLIPYTNSASQNNQWLIATGEISDTPNFEFRGSMLDVARHFFSVEDIKKYIDVMAYYKMNILHLHLSDDQGWRIEIKSWPELTTIGGHTEVGGKSGGFYTQEEYTEIVNYALQNHITIIPEIDMPGHTYAASVSYPFLDGAEDRLTILDNQIPDKKSLLYTGTEVGFSTFDTRKEEVYKFIDDVVKEISALTPGPYFHMGGDESHVTAHDDYEYFVNRVEKIIHKYNKTMIGWDEIATVDVNSGSIVQFWAEEENAQEAVDKGMKVILSPAKKIYLDMKYDSISKFGLHWAAYIPVDSSYNWSPENYIQGISKENILGIEAPLWSETISNIDELEYLAFPRLIGVSELGWSTESNRNWENYKVRLANQTPYLNQMKIKYYPSKLIDWKQN